MQQDDLDHNFQHALVTMEVVVNNLATKVPQPRFREKPHPPGFRYTEKSIQQAIVQKLARMVSTLHAARLLLSHGFVQEVGALQRILDEIQTDILFLRNGIENPEKLHKKYLQAFYQEEFDAESALESTQKRPMVPRKKIHAHVSRSFAKNPPPKNIDPSTGSEVLRTVQKTYSGYVHAASPHIMDLYGGLPPRFHMTGMLGTPLHEAHRQDLSNYFRRGLFAMTICALSFPGTADWADQLRHYTANFEEILDGIFGK